jgi:hypothetical protein
MPDHAALITTFYSAFSQKDYETMQLCYHRDARFSDPAFGDLTSTEVKAMWKMLLTSGTDLRIVFNDVHADEQTGKCHWEAWYSFSLSGNKVHNIIDASFEFKDGLIYRHHDHFNFWRWSGMALGLPGYLLGWTSFMQNKVSSKAKARLKRFMESEA